MKVNFNNIWVRVFLTLSVSVLMLAIVYILAWDMTNFYSSPSQFVKQGERITADMNEIYDSIAGSSDDSIKCRLIVSIESYGIQNGISENVHRTETLFANLAHTNALFLIIMFVTFVGVIFAIFQMASAYEDDKPHQNQIEIEGASIKLKTGYVSLAVSMIAIIALSLYLPNAHEVKQLPDAKPSEIAFDADKYFRHCSEYMEVRP